MYASCSTFNFLFFQQFFGHFRIYSLTHNVLISAVENIISCGRLSIIVFMTILCISSPPGLVTLFPRFHWHAETEVSRHTVIWSPNYQKAMITKLSAFRILQHVVVQKTQIGIFFTEDHVSKLCPNSPIFELIGLLLKFESFNFSDFAYYKRQIDNNGLVADSLVFFIVTKFIVRHV